MGRSRGRQQRHRYDKAIQPGAIATMSGANGGTRPRGYALADAINTLTSRAQMEAGNFGAVPMPRNPLDSVPFGPNWALPPQPLDPARKDTGRPMPRVMEYPVSWNLPGQGNKLVPWSVLVAASENVDILRRCIEIRKRHVRSMEWAWVVREDVVNGAYRADPRQGKDDVEQQMREKFLPEIQRLTTFWEAPWKSNGVQFGQWANGVIDQHLMFDGVAVYPRTTYGGDVLALEIIDAATIKPLLDNRGARPEPPFPAFQQDIYGFPRGEFTAAVTETEDGLTVIENAYLPDQLFYHRENFRPQTPYGYSAVEQSLISARLYLKRQGWMLAEYDDGSTPLMWLSPDGTPQMMAGASAMTATQRREWEDSLNDELTGQTAARHRVKVTPPGFKPIAMPSVDERYRPEYDLFLIKMLASHFGVTNTELGFSESQGLGNSGLHKGQADVSNRVGTDPDLKMLSEMINALSRDFLRAPAELAFVFVDPDSEDSQAEDLTANAQRMRGTITINDDRKRLGLAARPEPEADMLFLIAGDKATPIEGLMATIQAAQEQQAAAADMAQQQGQAAIDQTASAGGDVAKAAGVELDEADIATLALAEVAAYHRWAKRNPDPARPFMCKYAEPADFADADPDKIAFAEWEYTEDLLKSYEAWWPRDKHGRWIKRGHLGHVSEGPGRPGKEILDGLKSRGRKTPGKSASLAAITSPKTSTEDRKALARGLLEGNFAGLDVKVKHVEHSRLPGGGHATIIQADVLDKTGKKVGMVNRGLRDDGKLTADHDLVNLRQDLQGGGFTRELGDHLERKYAEGGVEEIHIGVGFDGGGYSAARTGYDFADKASADRARASLAAQIDVWSKDAGASGDVAKAREILRRMDSETFGSDTYPTAREISEVGRPESGGRDAKWLGKDALIGAAAGFKKPVSPESHGRANGSSSTLGGMDTPEVEAKPNTTMRPRTETYKGRKLRVAKGKDWASLTLTINGAHAGSVTGTRPEDMDKHLAQLRRDVDAMDLRRIDDPHAYPAEMYHGAPEPTAAEIAAGEAYWGREADDKAALARPSIVPDVQVTPTPRTLAEISREGDQVSAEMMRLNAVRSRWTDSDRERYMAALNRADALDIERREASQRENAAKDAALASAAARTDRPLTHPELGAKIKETVRAHPGEFMSIADLRDALGSQDRAQVDRTLGEMAGHKDTQIIPVANLKGLTARDHAAAVTVGGEPQHAIKVEGATTRIDIRTLPAPTTDEAKATRLRAFIANAEVMHGSDRAQWSASQQRQVATMEANLAKLTSNVPDKTPVSPDAVHPAPAAPVKPVFDQLLDGGLVKHKQARQIVEQLEAHGWEMVTQGRMMETTGWRAPDGRELHTQFLTGDKPKFYATGGNGGALTYRAALAHVVTPAHKEVGGPNVLEAAKRVSPGLDERISERLFSGSGDASTEPLVQATRQLSGYGGTQRRTHAEVSADLRTQAERMEALAESNAEHAAKFGDDPRRAREQHARAAQFRQIADTLDQQAAERKAYEDERERRASMPLDIRPTARDTSTSRGGNIPGKTPVSPDTDMRNMRAPALAPGAYKSPKRIAADAIEYRRKQQIKIDELRATRDAYIAAGRKKTSEPLNPIKILDDDIARRESRMADAERQVTPFGQSGILPPTPEQAAGMAAESAPAVPQPSKHAKALDRMAAQPGWIVSSTNEHGHTSGVMKYVFGGEGKAYISEYAHTDGVSATVYMNSGSQWSKDFATAAAAQKWIDNGAKTGRR